MGHPVSATLPPSGRRRSHAHSQATLVPTVSGGPLLGSVARPRNGSATSASVSPAAPFLLSPAPQRGPELRPHCSLPRHCGQPPARSSCPATLFLFRHFLTRRGGPARGRWPPKQRTTGLLGAFRRLGQEAGWGEELHGRARGRWGQAQPTASRKLQSYQACLGSTLRLGPAWLSSSHHLSDFYHLVLLRSLSSRCPWHTGWGCPAHSRSLSFTPLCPSHHPTQGQ